MGEDGDAALQRPRQLLRAARRHGEHLAIASLESKAITVDLSTGLEFALQSGGNLDLAIGATGVGGTLQGYSIRGAFRVPLN